MAWGARVGLFGAPGVRLWNGGVPGPKPFAKVVSTTLDSGSDGSRGHSSIKTLKILEKVAKKTRRPNEGREGGLRRVVISGPESTGKTTLARRLAERYRTAWVPEYVRAYLLARPPRDPPSLVLWEDVDAIARGQLEAEEAAARAATGVLFCDTDLHSTKVYCEHYFGRCPGWIARAARERGYDLHLLLGTGVPWVSDPLRDRPGEREQMLALFRTELRQAQRSTVEIQGGFDARFVAAVRAVEALLAGSG